MSASGSDPAAVDDLLAHLPWVEALARQLVSDPHLAADLAQSTFTTALQRPPRAARRGWLSAVLTNVLRQHRRRENDRRARESAAQSRRDAVPATDDTVARAEAHRLLVDAVLALDEPYRSVVLLRYFDDLPPREIARRTGTPVATVQSRLHRALNLLRGRLERARRGGWVTALLPLVRHPRPSHLIHAGVFLMKAKTALAVVLVAAAVWILWPAETGDGPEGTRTRVAGTNTTAPEGGSEDVPAARERVESPRTRESRPAETAATMFAGTLFDAEGRPLPDTGVRAANTDLRATSDERGSFELPQAPEVATILVEKDGWITVLAGTAPDATDARLRPVVVGAKRLRLGGAVVDERGAPVAGADVRCTLPPGFATRFPVSLDSSARHGSWRTTTDANGRFDLDNVGYVTGAKIVARRDNYLPGVLAQPAASSSSLMIVVARPKSDADLVRGQVVDRFGTPVAAALVGFGRTTTRTDGDGLFSLSRRKGRGATTELTAMKRGFLPASVEVPAAAPDAPAPFLFVRLGAEALTLRGRVVDAQGMPVADARVWVTDPRRFAGALAHVEGYLGGGRTNAELRREFTKDGELTRPLGELREAHPTALWGWTATDTRGRFTIGGLERRSYRVRALRMADYASVDAGPFQAGSAGARIVFAPRTQRVAGRVIAKDGTPVPGVSLELNCWAIRTRVEMPGGKHASSTAVVHGRRVRTGPGGRFDFGEVGTEGVFLSVNGDAIIDRNVGLHAADLASVGLGPPDDLRIEVVRRLHLRIEIADPALADRFRVLDPTGEPLQISSFEGGGKQTSGSWPLAGGKSRVLAVAETAMTVVLLKNGVEVRRSAVRLTAGSVNVVR